VRQIIDQHGLPAGIEHTATYYDILFREPDHIEDQGYVLNDEEELRGARAVGAPIFDQGKEVIGVVSVLGPSGRIDDDRFHDKLADCVYETANMIGANLEVEGYQTLTDSGTQPWGVGLIRIRPGLFDRTGG
jgi:DNA-binding IclR family transcriptional regulator